MVSTPPPSFLAAAAKNNFCSRPSFNYIQGCIRSLSPLKGGVGKFIMSVGEEYHVVKRGREYHGCWEEYNKEKRERGSNMIFPLILRLLGRISGGAEGKGKEIKL